MKQDVMSCSAKAPMCPCYKALAEKKGAETFEAQAPRGHKMMTAALGNKIPPLYSQDEKGDEAIVYAHYFNPYGIGEWWILEWDGKEEMFGYADEGSQFPELGYISLSELENISIGRLGLPLERDLHWREKTLGEVKKSKSFSAEGGSKGEWKRAGGNEEEKVWAEEYVESLIEQGYKARLNSTSKPVKTPFGTIKGKRWFAEKFVPDGAVDFRRGKWMKLIDKNGGLGLENMTPVEVGEGMNAESHAYSYAYNNGHSDSRKGDDYRPNLSGSRQEADFKKILKQKAEYSRDSDGRFSSKSAISLTTAAIIGLAGAYLWRGKK